MFQTTNQLRSLKMECFTSPFHLDITVLDLKHHSTVVRDRPHTALISPEINNLCCGYLTYKQKQIETERLRKTDYY